VNFSACPKCGHAPLPANQSAPAACPACGLILAKFGAAPHRPRRAADNAGSDALVTTSLTSHERAGIGALLLHVPDQVSKTNWIGRILALTVLSLWTLWIWRDTDIPAGEIGSNFLHIVLLPFHEAGHYAIFRWFGQFIMTLGGTLGQHLMPTVLGVALLVKRRDPFGAALFFWLLGFSVIDMGVYMYDAFDPQLQLLGGGTGAEQDGHDWQNIFGDLNLLRHARGIGSFFGWVGKAMMLAGLAWAAWILRLQQAKLSDSPFAEDDKSDFG